MSVTTKTKEHIKSENIQYNEDLSSCFMTVMESLKESKAEDICHIENTSERSLICDNMIIVSGRSIKHVSSIADNLLSCLKKKKINVIGIDGFLASNWILIDIGSMMIHVFQPEARKLYNLEAIWT
ncbi:MAG: ribosome silencing factor [Candidatus Liberibacter ctenarytainae]|uniref:Ribosomal silencing factor RsfS n=1 Tax=Candidatus Liberibacter ctenarytainae TaxID=2020335 RepID=A0A937AIV3_9HYPH|nr:ribosome silencing factor [Candidatus Liberibacter ctenarytainae]